MTSVILKTITIFTLLLAICSSALAQQSGNLDDAIGSLTNNIATLESMTVSPSMQSTHRENIKDQRIDLIALLGQKKGEVESYINSASSSLRPDQRDKLLQQVSDLDNRIALQKAALTGKVVAVNGTSATTSLADDVAISSGHGAREGTSTGTGTVSDSLPVNGGTVVPGDTARNTSNSSVAIERPPSSSPTSAAPAASPSTSSTNCPAVLLAPTSFGIREQQICALVAEIKDNKLGIGLPRAAPDADLRLEGAEDYIVNIITQAKALGDVEDTRTDKQAGSDAQSKGTTSLVVKGGTPAVFAWAVENGGASATTDGTTINFRVNPLGVIKALSNTGYFAAYDESERDLFTKFLRKTSFGISFDVSRGDQPGVFTGNKQQISAFSARYEFISDRDPRNKKYAAKWANLVDKNQIEYTNAAVKLRAAIIDEAHLDTAQCADPNLNVNSNPQCQRKLILAQFKDPVLQKWLDETNAQLRAIRPTAATPEVTVVVDVERVIRTQVGLLSSDKIGATTRSQIISFVESLNSYITARKSLLDEIAKGKVMAFEYTNHREVNAPDTSNFNFIAEKGTVGRMDLTFNASLNMYNSRPAAANVKRIRDFVFAGQFDAPLREISGVGRPVFSIAGRYERTTGNAFALDGTIVPNTKGDVGSLQLKLMLPIKGTGIRLPFSVTFANRTQLIREREVRANFGFTFDLDRLLANNPFFKK